MCVVCDPVVEVLAPSGGSAFIFPKGQTLPPVGLTMNVLADIYGFCPAA